MSILTREQWRKLPLHFRQKWWQETDYGKRPPEAALMQQALELLQNGRTEVDVSRDIT
jgi:hypothetical protein